MKDVIITDSILYVGVDDKTLDLFESEYYRNSKIYRCR
mgnify:CR=1 FL=1